MPKRTKKDVGIATKAPSLDEVRCRCDLNEVRDSATHIHERETADGRRLLFLDYGNAFSKYNNGKRYEPMKDSKGNRLYLRPVQSDEDARHNEYVLEQAEQRRKTVNDAIRKGVVAVGVDWTLGEWLEHCARESEAVSREGMGRNPWANKFRLVAKMIEDWKHEPVKMSDIDGSRAFARGFVKYLANGYTISRGQQNAGKHLHPNTAADRYTILSCALQRAVESDEVHFDVNPCRLLGAKDKIKTIDTHREALTIEEVQRLASTPMGSERTRRVFLFMCFTGLRISDVKRLTWGDVHRDGDDWVLSIVQQKSRRANTIYLPADAVQFLPERRTLNPKEMVFNDIPTEPAMNRALKIWARAAGIEKNVTLHIGRHTAATIAITEGADIYEVQQMLGHSKPQITQIYAEMASPRKKATARRFNGILSAQG